MAEHTVYYMCKYTPLELLAGFGVEVKRIEPDTNSFAVAESLGHPNMCGYGKGLLEAVMAGDVHELILVNCCDVVRRIYDILRAEADLDFLYIIDLPHGTAEADVCRMQAETCALRDAYAEFLDGTSQPTEYGKVESLQGNAQNDLRVPRDGAYISLRGAHSGAFLAELVRDKMPLPVQDDTCVGNRVVDVPVPCDLKPGESMEHAYARALLMQTPCMRMNDVGARESLGKGAAGILYHTMKFCDYYGFEYADLAKKTEQPILKIETDGTRQSSGQLATRLDAFAESLPATHKERPKMQEDMYTVGIDSGSTSTDAAVLDPNGELVGWSVIPTGAGAATGAGKALEAALSMAGITKEKVGKIVSTGYGRETIGIGDESITEITCHARGARYLLPTARTVIDIGGQDSKIIRMDENGAVTGFVMNDKCAAGTGRFLEMMARTMEMSLEEMSGKGLSWKEEITISSMCTVFAESEVVSLIAENKDIADIVHGLNESVASRTAALLKRVGEQGDYMMTGGVAANKGVVAALEKRIGHTIHVSEKSQLCGAIGAALLAREA